MFIEREKYCWNSLRKGRLLGFESDIQEAFSVFKNYMLEPEDINAKQFGSIAQNSQFSLLIHCRAEQEDEEQYVQLLYQIIICNFMFNAENYFNSQNQPKQIFSIYALYFLYSQLQRKRRINVDMDFLDLFLSILKKYSLKIDKHWMMIARKLTQNCFTVGIKTGLKTYLIKSNGQPARKGKYHQTLTRKIDTKMQEQDQEKQQQKQYMTTLKSEISQLQMSLQSYSKGKQKFNNQPANSQNRLLFSDKNLGIRLIKKYTQYQKLLSEKNYQQKYQK